MLPLNANVIAHVTGLHLGLSSRDVSWLLLGAAVGVAVVAGRQWIRHPGDRRYQLSSDNLLILTGFYLQLGSIKADSLRIGSRNGEFGRWQLAGVLVGLVLVCGGLALKISPIARLVEPDNKIIWLLPRVIAIAAATLIIVTTVPHLGRGPCPSTDPGGRHQFSHYAATPSHWYSGAPRGPQPDAICYYSSSL